ncbi:RloB family protein [Motilimonas sp. KMU-193]|uniref:RloB family protein n=1 Tax=Motilimonas sp. KMU-193 TaxID=3388668 RepID=UPI00396B20A7
MGSDDLFHKIKARANKLKKREHNKKEPYPKFLIVCEDTVSGYYYLTKAVKHFRLSSANFCIVGLGQDPMSIVLEAEKRYNNEKSSHKPDFEQVFCVFDKDNHAKYYNAIDKINAINRSLGEIVFKAITSVPCFEIWLILHFTYTTKLYSDNQSKSAANQVVADLIKIMDSYKKSSSDAFEQTIEHLPVALNNANKLGSYCKKTSSESPSTRMNELMEFISKLNNNI